MKTRPALRALLLITSLVGIGFALHALQLTNLLQQDWIDTHLRSAGWSGVMLFIAAGAVATAAAVPRQGVAFLSGYAFGLWPGVLVGVTATLLGCCLSFYYTRLFARELVARRFPLRLQSMDRFLGTYPFSMAVLLRLLPLGSNFVINLLAGVSSVAARPFLLGSALGYVPQTFIFALAGSGIEVGQGHRLSLAAALFVASALLGAYLYRRFRLDRADQRPGVAEAGGAAGK